LTCGMQRAWDRPGQALARHLKRREEREGMRESFPVGAQSKGNKQQGGYT
jgi:hypothetical protein